MSQLMFKQFLDGLWDSLTQPIQDWLAAHPIGNWLLTHPLWGIGLVVIALLLLSGLLGAIAQLTQKLWIALLRSPVVLTGWFFMGLVQLFRAVFRLKANPTLLAASAPAETQRRLSEILDRLESLKQEQEDLLQEAKKLVGEQLPQR